MCAFLLAHQPQGAQLTGLGPAVEIAVHFDSFWKALPMDARDFILRSLRMFGLPIDYPSFPVWAERAARHLITICYPTLRKCDLANPNAETFGRFAGHMLAISAHAKSGTAIFQKMDGPLMEEAKALFINIAAPVRKIVDESLQAKPAEAEAFLKGMNHSFSRTFDRLGWPIGWNTSSPVQIALAVGWRFIAEKRPTLPQVHAALAALLGEPVVGSAERVKKLCHRLGLRFDGQTAEAGGTPIVLDVPAQAPMIQDKKRIAQQTKGDSNEHR